MASVKSIRAVEGGPARVAPFAVAGMALVVVLGLGFFTLFGLRPDEPRCWVETAAPSGGTSWERRANVGGPDRLSAGSISGVGRGVCTSDIITDAEAATGLGIIVAAALAMTGVSRLGPPQPDHERAGA